MLTLFAAKAALKNGLGQGYQDLTFLAYPTRMCRAHGGLPLPTNNTILKKFRFLSPMEKGGIKLDTNK